MNALTPWTGLTGLKQEMDRVFDRLFEPHGDAPSTFGDWMPKLDVVETKDAVVVKTEVPGVVPEDIHVSLEHDVLVIKGEKTREKEEKDERYHRVERSWGSFARTVRLPAPVDASKAGAAFTNGLLTITLPKTAAAKGTPIPVKAQ